MQMQTSRIPAAIDGLLTLCTGAAAPGGPLAGVRIYDGPPVSDLSDELLLFIGDDPAGEDSVTGTQEYATLGRPGKDETFTIYCCAASRSGNVDMKRERGRAFGIVGAVERLVRPNEPGGDTQLGGAVLWSGVGGDITLSQMQTNTGALARVTFGVVCRARL
ncbi:hypothetical protein [Goodfellowiella coeruleoviolacea]|uniref:Uncharacterized protein n=1 Tax=Goodfellowiella coeruleoviolacea TaxID=334858 RepID=A0AAE3GH43_9PSEU|nr:hypothetical protein [Goodfellowiella coeruleoviolacea]MCP2168131.1 hypothetical protein [Goodfellowiella coeruleoviolacea]